jgi:hypothetical protein
MLTNDPRAAALLDEIHAALLHHDYGTLASLGAALEQELDHPGHKLTPAALDLIRRKADRNAATLLAVQRGIRAAVRRITEIRSVSTGMVGYDRFGQRQENVAKGLTQRL